MFSTPFGIPSTLKRHVSNWMAFHAIGVFLSGGRWNDLKTKYTQYGPSMSSPLSFGTVSPPGRSFFRPVWPEPAGSDVGIHGIKNWTFDIRFHHTCLKCEGICEGSTILSTNVLIFMGSHLGRAGSSSLQGKQQVKVHMMPKEHTWLRNDLCQSCSRTLHCWNAMLGCVRTLFWK